MLAALLQSLFATAITADFCWVAILAVRGP